MDVVKTNIEKIGGTHRRAEPVGAGTTFRHQIPLTLAIIPALTVTCAGDRYAIPQVNLLELVRLEGERRPSQVEADPRRPGLPAARQPAARSSTSTSELGVGRPVATTPRHYIVVLQAEDRQFGLVVDDVATPRRSSSSRWARSSRASRASTPARRSSATAASR